MIGITSTAVRHLVRRRDERGVSPQSGARLAPSSRGIRLSYADSPQPGDSQIDTPEINVYLAPDLAGRLEGSIIDVRDTDDGAALVVKRQPAHKEAAS
jgi:Fe-S cluster assembly iron-binding protein IscA